jgi:aspartyl-tRNA(Asn)/glutamyl-tRNA(Gln) amidotransferase subunit A
MNGIADTVAEVRAGATCESVVRKALDRAGAAGGLNAFLEVSADRALERARALDAARARGGAMGPLLGVPVAVKDNLCTSWGVTTAGSLMLRDYRSPFTATAVARLEAAGAVVIGKTNLDEFAMGSSGESSAFGPTKNPWDESRVPGGSSAGSAAAVAAGVVPAALGSDTGGSIRQPASHCGVVGVKPTYGRVSRSGLIAYASSLDQVGPLARSVGDAALVLAAICGEDPADATSSVRPAPDFSNLDEPVKGLRVGVPKEARTGGDDPAVSAALERAVTLLRGAGAEVVSVDLPSVEYAVAAYYIVAAAEASSNLARFDGVRYGRRAALGNGDGLVELYCKSRSEGLGPEVKRRIMLGTHVLSSGYYDAYYTTALKARRLLKGDFDVAWASGVHAVMMPASPGPAFRLGEKTSDLLAMYLEDVYTVGVNLAGLPGVTVPVSAAVAGGKELPIGVQLIGPAFGESGLLRAARMLERVTGWEGRRAPWVGRVS